jgi:alpha-ketoglutarate-dependent taurine dioxygenase
MKTSKIPGLGRFGIFIDDLDFTNLSDDEWMEIGKLHLENLVTIIRNVNLNLEDYENRMSQWGISRNLHVISLRKKYGTYNLGLLFQHDVLNGVPVDQADKEWIMTVSYIRAVNESQNDSTNVVRVTGKLDDKGNNTGLFNEGELFWHSNESGIVAFAPGVSLLGAKNMTGSCTGFVTTTDWYESQTESFRSELDEMIIKHQYSTGKINPGLRHEHERDLAGEMMCPTPSEIPLIIQSPGGIKGLHFPANTINSVKGMTDEDSKTLFDYINKTLFTNEYMYDHWYQQDNDLLLFDNSITMHRRLSEQNSGRLAYRIQHDYRKITNGEINPYFQEPYMTQFNNWQADITMYA